MWLSGSLGAACELSVATYEIKFPDLGLNLGPLYWKHRVLATGPTGKSLTSLIESGKGEEEWMAIVPMTLSAIPYHCSERLFQGCMTQILGSNSFANS